MPEGLRQEQSGTPMTTQVLIVGGGPCGLMLANELGRRGIEAILIDQKATTAFSPQANACQARSMEHFRRLGFADEIRAMGLPNDYPTDIAYFTRYMKPELSRFKRPSSGEATQVVKTAGGSWTAAELPHRVSQKFVEQVLYRHACALPTISIAFGWRLEAFEEAPGHVATRICNVNTGEMREVRAQYVYGADGARSFVRRQLGFHYDGDSARERDFMGGQMLAVFFKAPDFYARCPGERAWMYTSFNDQRRALLIAVDGVETFFFHAQLHPHEQANDITDEKAIAYIEEAMGEPIKVSILHKGFWLAGRALVADHFQRGRIFLGGDAVHLFTPTGGMGYNTAIEDAVNIGWKLAAVLKSQAPESLLDSYEGERRPVAIRNTGFARQFADSIGLYKPTPALEKPGRAGDAARQRAGEYLANHAASEFNIPGFTLGARYDTSSIIAADPAASPPDRPGVYVQSGKPGGRAPHVWLEDGRSLFDTFGFEWTLLCMGARKADVEGFQAAAKEFGVELSVVDCDDEIVADLYGSALALIRPDQVVAWRRITDEPDARQVLALALGRITRDQKVQN